MLCSHSKIFLIDFLRPGWLLVMDKAVNSTCLMQSLYRFLHHRSALKHCCPRLGKLGRSLHISFCLRVSWYRIRVGRLRPAGCKLVFCELDKLPRDLDREPSFPIVSFARHASSNWGSSMISSIFCISTATTLCSWLRLLLGAAARSFCAEVCGRKPQILRCAISAHA